MTATDTVMTLIKWACVASPLVVFVAVCCYMVGARAGRAAGERERGRLAQRLETFTTILRPVAAAARQGKPGFRMPPQDIAVLTLLVDLPGEDGDKIAELEALFHKLGPPD
ncbi:hypothetical protein ACFOY2_46255 [Nonomuraea purpurea]|uniref:Uncharacterized protein n=1 Tax=Nonomuraea purpurea TaxID=1849276 RepID=A0ABV8GQT4_9ACTN